MRGSDHILGDDLSYDFSSFVFIFPFMVLPLCFDFPTLSFHERSRMETVAGRNSSHYRSTDGQENEGKEGWMRGEG